MSTSAIEPVPPLFIIGVLNRSGTNYLGDLLRILPEFEMPTLKEDYVLEHAACLGEYVAKSAHRWRSIDNAEGTMLRCLGDGILSFLRLGCCRHDSRILVKTPRPYGLDKFPELFPSAKALLLIRDGRDIVESAGKELRVGIARILDAGVETVRTHDARFHGGPGPRY